MKVFTGPGVISFGSTSIEVDSVYARQRWEGGFFPEFGFESIRPVVTGEVKEIVIIERSGTHIFRDCEVKQISATRWGVSALSGRSVYGGFVHEWPVQSDMEDFLRRAGKVTAFVFLPVFLALKLLEWTNFRHGGEK